MQNILDLAELDPYLSQLTQTQLEDLFAQISGYKGRVVDINEFLDSDEFLGPFWSGGLYPFWRKELNRIYPSPHYSPYWLISLRGAIGLGKTQIACTGLCYDLYKLIFHDCPQSQYGLLASTKILFAIFNRTLTLSADVVWDKLSQMFLQSPFFNKFETLHRKRKSKDETLFPNRIDFTMGSRVGHSLGQAIHSAILSEANFEVVDGQVYETFNSIINRMQSRFMTPGGGIPGKIWVDSSETEKFSVVNKIVDSYRTDPGVYVVQSAAWDVKPHKYGTQRFWVYKGSDTRKPEMLDESNPIIQKEPDLCIQVPVEHKQAFTADINEALRSIAGVATTSSYKLFRLRDKLSTSMNVLPIFPETIQLDFSDDFDQIINYLKFKSYFQKPIHPNIPRYIHIDIALSGDRLGIGASYVSGFTDRTSYDIITMDQIVERVPRIINEWAFGIEAKPGQQIPLYKVRVFIQWLSKNGYLISQVTCDGFNSADMLQLLTKIGYDTELISVDRTIDPYIQLRNGIYEGRTSICNSSIIRRECLELEVSADGQKVDHPKKNEDGSPGSKDVADAICGSVFNAERNAHKMRLVHLVSGDPMPGQNTAAIKEMFWNQSQ